MAGSESSDLHGRPPLSIPFPLELGPEGLGPGLGSEPARTKPASTPSPREQDRAVGRPGAVRR
ncbi:MAG: hypothetical protein D6695_10830 [Planctomycetota bacterium]|nr:MAG: hypothetical protein D6695_10830 [Planctomycetota bacterium]